MMILSDGLSTPFFTYRVSNSIFFGLVFLFLTYLIVFKRRYKLFRAIVIVMFLGHALFLS